MKPIHSLVASVTDGISKPRILATTISAYDHVLKPSDASNLESDDVIFYADDNFETSVKTFAKSNVELAQLSESVNLLPARSHSFSREIIRIQDEKDLHIWLNPENAKSTTLRKCNSIR
jgi:zinc transport system substrate-binding protein